MFHFHKGLSLSPLTTTSPTNPFLLIYGLQCRNSSSHRFVIIISIVVIDIIIAIVIFPLDKIPPDKIFGCVKFNTWSPPDSHHALNMIMMSGQLVSVLKKRRNYI